MSEKKQSTKTTVQYVDNVKFYQALREYQTSVKEAVKDGLPKPKVTNYLGECFLKIATHLSYKGNFINYSYRDEMIADGVENCLMAVDKFDCDKYTNPFAYYTQIIFFAFIRRIQKEKKQQATKYRLLDNIDFEELLAHVDDNSEYVEHIVELMRRQVDLVEPERREVGKKPNRKK